MTAFEFEVDEVGDVGFAQLAFDASDTAGFLQAWGDWVVDAPRDLTSFLIMGGRDPASRRRAGHGGGRLRRPRHGALAAAAARRGGAAHRSRTCASRAIARSSRTADDAAHAAEGEPTARSGLIGRITPEFARDAARFLDSGATYFFQLRAVGGAVHDVPAEATAFAHRSAEFSSSRSGSSRQQTSTTDGTSSSARTSTAPT